MLLNWDSPLLPIHILWINLVTDSLPALALGVEPVDKDIMKRPPRDANKSIFADGLATVIGLQGVMIGLLTLISFIFGKNLLSQGLAHEDSVIVGQTMAFATLAFSQLVHAFNVRSANSLFKVGVFTNRMMLLAFAISFSMQFLVLVVPALNQIFKVTALNGSQWLTVIGLSLAPLLIVEIGKLFRRAKN